MKAKLETLSVSVLREFAKDKNIKNISTMRKSELIDAIIAAAEGEEKREPAEVEAVVSENTTFLKQVISESFNTVIKKDEFKNSIINAFSHKVARNIISNNDGLFDKVSNELKQDAVFKSKMALAVSNVVEECLTERNSN